MRPLFFEETDNTGLYESSDTYLWGDEFLVSPVVQSGITEQEIYFPANFNWYDFYTLDKYTGGSTQIVTLAEEHIPIFVRGGSFIPMVKPVQTTRNYSTDKLQLHYYYDTEVSASQGKLYDDDGIKNITSGKSSKVRMHVSNTL